MNDGPYTLTPLGLLSAVVWDGERLTFSRLAKAKEAS